MHDVDLTLTLAGALAIALVFGYFTQRMGLSPIVGYLLADLALDLTIFRLFGILNDPAHPPMKWWVIGGVNFGVWVHAVLLVYLIFAFVKAQPREPLASFGFRRSPLTTANR